MFIFTLLLACALCQQMSPDDAGQDRTIEVRSDEFADIIGKAINERKLFYDEGADMFIKKELNESQERFLKNNNDEEFAKYSEELKQDLVKKYNEEY